MPDVIISQTVDQDFVDYQQGDTFSLEVEFFEDLKQTVPEDVSAMSFFMDIKPKMGHECFCPPDNTETLAIGSGISHGPGINAITFSKILESGPGLYNQSIRSVDPAGVVITRIKGILKIEAKI